MKKRINRCEFIFDMQSYYKGNGFSFEGLNCLFDYLTDWEEQTGEELEFNVVALHSQFSEMRVNDFLIDYYNDEDIEEILSEYYLKSIDEITANVLYEYECLCKYARIVAVIDDEKIIVDIER